MSPPEKPGWSPARALAWVLVAGFVVLVMGQRFVAAFRPQPGMTVDFLQEWLSAKNYWAGMPVYTDQIESYREHLGLAPKRPEHMIRYNAHPPASVLLALPFGRLGYGDAMLAWNLLTFPLFLVAVALVIRELGIPFGPASLIPAAAIVVAAHPVFFQVAEGQLNCLLVFLLTAAWVADRRGWQTAAGVAVGLAGAIKLIPLFVLVYFAAAGRWRAVAGAAAAFLLLNGAAAAVLGADAFRVYAAEVVPGVAHRFDTVWRNSSLVGFWMRLFGPQPATGMVAAADAPQVGKAVVTALRLGVVAACGWVAWRSRATGDRDKAFAAALVGMLLVSPLTWAHYFMLLLLPLGLVWMRTPGVLPRVVMWLAFVVLWLPDTVPVYAFLGKDQGQRIGSDDHRPLQPAEILYTVSLPHYALVALFLLTLFAPPPWPGERDPGGTADDAEERLNRRLFGDPEAS